MNRCPMFFGPLLACYAHVHNLLCLEVFLFEIVAQRPYGSNILHSGYLSVEFSSLEGDDSVWKSVVLFFGDILAGYLYEVDH